MVRSQPWQLTTAWKQGMNGLGLIRKGKKMRDALDYFPIAGTAILTGGIVWVGVSTWIGNRRKIRSALAGAGSNSPLTDRSTCCNSFMQPLGWTEDGWVATCRQCGSWQFLGDDHEHPPVGFNEDGSPREGWNAAPYGFYATGGDINSPNSRRTLPNSRPVASEPAPPFPGAGSPFIMREQIVRRPLDEHEINDALAPEVTSSLRADLLEAIEDEGEPLPGPPQPNLGGIGKPAYHGPHYDSVIAEESRYVPYEVLRDPLPDAAVHFAGDGDAVAGPLAVEHGGSEHESSPGGEEDDS